MNENIIEELMYFFTKLPTLGQKSARRLTFHILNNRNTMNKLILLLDKCNQQIKQCSICTSIDISDPCQICNNPHRDKTKLCIVDNIDDMLSIERSGCYRGLYHILKTENESSSEIPINGLFNRLKSYEHLSEIIMAHSPTVQGQIVSFYILENIQNVIDSGVKITTLSQGVPLGATIDHLDDATISVAFNERKGIS